MFQGMWSNPNASFLEFDAAEYRRRVSDYYGANPNDVLAADLGAVLENQLVEAGERLPDADLGARSIERPLEVLLGGGLMPELADRYTSGHPTPMYRQACASEFLRRAGLVVRPSEHSWEEISDRCVMTDLSHALANRVLEIGGSKSASRPIVPALTVLVASGLRRELTGEVLGAGYSQGIAAEFVRRATAALPEAAHA